MAEGDRSPPHIDAPWINSPILFISGPLRGKWIRAELSIQQQPKRGRKGAIHDLRPVHPPPTVRLRLFEVQHSVPAASVSSGSYPEVLHFHSSPSLPPSNAPETLINITPRLTTHFLCFASLFKVHPPTREQEYGRVDRKVMVGAGDGATTSSNSQYSSQSLPGELVERPKSDRSRGWKAVRPHPMTAISCRDPRWNAALQEAWAQLHHEGRLNSPPKIDLDTSQDSVRGIEQIEGDISFQDMALLEPYLPREAPKWVMPYRDVTAHLSKRETAGHLIPSYENGESALYFVFSDLAIRNEGYFSLRFHVINLDWRVDSRFTRPGAGIFSPLADCVTDTFAVYSTKEFPGLPPTTEFTSYLVRQGVRIRFRDDRAVDAAVGESRSKAEGKKRATRRGSGVQKAESSIEDVEESAMSATSAGHPTISVPSKKTSDAWSPAMLEAANDVAEEVWRSKSQSNTNMLNRVYEESLRLTEVDTPTTSTSNGGGLVRSTPPPPSTYPSASSQDRLSRSTLNLFISPTMHTGRQDHLTAHEHGGQRISHQANVLDSPNQPMYSPSPITDNHPMHYSSPHEPSQTMPRQTWPSTYPMVATDDISPTGHAWSQRDAVLHSSHGMMQTNSPIHQSPRERHHHRYVPYPSTTAQGQGMSSPHQEYYPTLESPVNPHSHAHYRHPNVNPYSEDMMMESNRSYRNPESHLRERREDE